MCTEDIDECARVYVGKKEQVTEQYVKRRVEHNKPKIKYSLLSDRKSIVFIFCRNSRNSKDFNNKDNTLSLKQCIPEFIKSISVWYRLFSSLSYKEFIRNRLISFFLI